MAFAAGTIFGVGLMAAALLIFTAWIIDRGMR